MKCFKKSDGCPSIWGVGCLPAGIKMFNWNIHKLKRKRVCTIYIDNAFNKDTTPTLMSFSCIFTNQIWILVLQSICMVSNLLLHHMTCMVSDLLLHHMTDSEKSHYFHIYYQNILNLAICCKNNLSTGNYY